jgi:hypothetical protein
MYATAILLAVVGTLIAGPAPAQAGFEQAPASVTAIPGKRSLVVNWTAAGTYDGTLINYVVSVSPGGASCSVAYNNPLTCTFNGLTAGTSYTATVGACYGLNDTNCYDTVGAPVVVGPPGTPAAPTVAYNGNPNSVTVSWATPAGGAGIASYLITSTPTGLTGTCTTLITFGTNFCVYSGLTTGTSYTFRVTANGTGSTGSSAASPASIPKIAGPPGAPQNVTLVRDSDSSLTLSWSPAAAGNAPAASYVVTTSNSVNPMERDDCVASPCTFNGLVASTAYTFQVAAIGAGGSVIGGSSAPVASAAVKPGAPGAPGAPTVELGVAGTVTVTWTAPSTGGTPLTYTVTPTPSTGLTGTCASAVTAPTVTCDYSGLVSGQPYTFVVTANNASGNVASAASDPVVSSPPAQPTSVTATVGSSAGSAIVSWVQPTGGVVSYFTVTPTPGDAADCAAGPSATTCSFTGLNPAALYTFVVTAVGDLGSVPSASSAGVYLSVPHMPGTPTVALNSTTSATVTWTAPTGVGSGPVDSYTVAPVGAGAGSATVPGSCAAPSATTCTITGLTPATSYTFTVTAVNGAGPSSASTSAAVLTSAPNVPGTPTVVLTASNGATVTWTAPIGGAPVNSYTLVSNGVATATIPGGCVGTALLTCSVTGLVADGAYRFKVSANNGAGSTDSANSAVVVNAKPSVPTTPTVTLTSPTSVVVSWTQPSGGPVVTYTLTPSGGPATVGCVLPTSIVCPVTGLQTGGSYTFVVNAANAVGTTDSLASAAVVVGAPGAPGAPTVVLTSPSAATVSWTAPVGGAPAANYTLVSIGTPTITIPGGCIETTSLTCTISGMSSGGSYRLKVTATNGAGSTDSANGAIFSESAPDQPGVITVVLGSGGQATLTWPAPTSGGPVESYMLTADGPFTSGPSCLAASAVSCVVSGLTAGQAYTFTLTALNVIFTSLPRTSDAVIVAVPGAPTALKVVVDSTTAATVSWTAPTTGGPVASYTVVANGLSPGSVPGSCLLAGAVSCSITGLVPGDPYNFTVTPSNGVGAGTAATSAWVSLTAPGAPGQPTVVVNSTTQMTVSWTAPINGGPVTYYVVESIGFMNIATIPAPCLTTVLLTCVVPGLSLSGLYQFRVTAHNGAGDTPSPDGLYVRVGAPGTPGTPTVVLTAPATATVSWTAPMGGGLVTSYALAATGTGLGLGTAVVSCSTPTSLSCSISNLIAGETYTFVVTATNGASSVPSSSSTPVLIAAPGVPTLLRAAVVSSNAATLSWTAPTTGGPVSSYTVVPTGIGAGSATIPSSCLLANAVSCAITGLTAGESYTFAVAAVNGVGTGTAATTAGVPIAAPDAPTAVSGVVNSATTATFHWTAPTTGGPVDGYQFQPISSGMSGAVEAANCTTPGSMYCTFTNITSGGLAQIYVSAYNGVDPSLGALSPALRLTAPVAPGTPTAVVTSSTTATLTWAAASSGGTPSSYTVVSNGTNTATIPGSCITTTSLSCALTGLTAGESYKFKVNAINGISNADSADSAVLVITMPGAPGVPTVQVLSAGSVRVTWTAASGSFTSYTVAGYTVAAPGVSFPSTTGCTTITALTCDFTGLNTTDSYQFLVTANGVAGGTPSGAKSTAVNTAPPGTGLAPTVALAGPNAVRVTWLAPSGGATTGYTVTSDPVLTAPAGCTNVLTLTCVFDHLASGTPYTFRVVASGASGTPVPSLPSEIIIPGPPDIPLRPTVTQTGDTTLRVSWIAPAAGAGYIGYKVESMPTGHDCETGLDRDPDIQTTCLIEGLTEGDQYAFRVQAIGVEGGGNSPFSRYSDTVRVGEPGAPVAPEPTAVVTGLGQVSVSWNEPDGGGVITDYSVRALPYLPGNGTQCADHILASPCLFTGLNPGVTYTFVVTAYGTGDWQTDSVESNPVLATRPGTPGVPSVALSVVDEEVTATVDWEPPTTGGPVTSYLVTVTPDLPTSTDPSPSASASASPSPSESETVPPPPPLTTPIVIPGNLDRTADVCGEDPNYRHCVFTGLDPAVTYTFHVEAVGPAGFSKHASHSVPVRADAPGAPGTPTAVVVDGDPMTVTLSWTAPIDGGTVDRYVVDADGYQTDDMEECGADLGNLTCVVRDLNPGSAYSFTVTAVGPLTGTPSETSDVVRLLPAGKPGTPTVVNGATGSVIVNWEAPEGGGPVTDYTVVSTPASAGPTGCYRVTTTSCLYTGLNPARSYTFVVSARGPIGEPMPSDPSTSATAGPPAAPGTPSVHVTGPGTVTVSWSPSLTGGPLEGYSVNSDPPVSPPQGCTNTELTFCTFTGLNPGTSYTFGVTANGLVGDTPSLARSTAVIPNLPGVPDAPTVVVTGVGTVQVSWAAPTGGAVITSYTVTSLPALDPLTSVCVEVTGISCSFTGLNPGTEYAFKVTANGPSGGTTSASWSSAVKPAAPTAPAVPTVAVVGSGSVRVTWEAPSGGGPRTSYSVFSIPTSTPPSSCTATSNLTCDFTGLNTATSYTFVVTANGPAGNSASSASASVTPAPTGAPGTPTVVVLSPTTARVTWTASSNATSYTVTSSPSASPTGGCTNISALTCVFDGLTAGSSYTFRVTAQGAAGDTQSPASSTQVSTAPAGVPGTPAVSTTVAGTVHLVWTAPTTPAGPVTGYTVVSDPDATAPIGCLNTLNLTCDFSGLSNGSHTFLVTAIGPGGNTNSASSTAIIAAAPTAPAAPTVALGGPNAVTVSWVAPSGAPVTSYSVAATPTATVPSGCTATSNLSCTFTGLAGGTSYTFKVTAAGSLSPAGVSPASAPIITGPPNAPARPTVTPGSSNTEATVTWVAPSGLAGITGYTVTSSPTSTGCTAGSSATSCVVTGLTASTSYTFTVRANGTTGGGNSDLSPASTSFTAGALSAPTGVSAVGGNAQLAVSWTAPVSTVGLAHYVATASPGGLTCQSISTATNCVITGLTNGEAYTVTVVAVGTNVLTNSSPSTASTPVRATVGAPGAPTGVQAVGGVTNATVSWNAPVLTGDGIDHYTATPSPNGTPCSTLTAATRTCVITGLTNGSDYAVTVVAVGVNGSGTSSPSTSVTVKAGGAPGAPTGVTASTTVGTPSISVGFTPSTNLGAGVTGYTATATGGASPLTCTPVNLGTYSCVINGVTVGTTYTVTVVANGPGGTSAAGQAPSTVSVANYAAPTLPAIAPSGANVYGSVTSSAGLTLAANATTTISGSTYAPYAGITVGIYPGPIVLGTAVSDSAGNFSLAVTLPNVTTGAHTIVAAGNRAAGSVRYRSSAVTITAAPGLARRAVSGSAGTIARHLPASRLSSHALVSRVDR